MTALIPGYTVPSAYGPAAPTLVGQQDDVRKGIWPSSYAFWFGCFYVAIFLIRPWEKLFPWLEAIRFERLFVAVLIIAMMADRGFRITADRQTLALFGLLGALSVCTLCAVNPLIAWEQSGGLYSYLTTAFGFFVIASVVRTRYELTFLITSQLVATGLYLGKSLWEFHIHDAGSYSMGVLRLSGIDVKHSHPNSVATMTVLSLPIWAFVWQHRESLTAMWPHFWRTWFTRCLKIYLGIVVLTLMGANSRTSYVSATLFALMHARRRGSLTKQIGYFIVFLCVGAVVWIALPIESRLRIQSIWDKNASNESAKESADGRKLGFYAGMEMFRRSPLVGVGVNNFMEYRKRYLDGINLVAHNVAGELLGQTGLLGTAAFAAFIIVLWSNTRELMSIGPYAWGAPPGYYYGLGQLGRDSTVLLLFHGLTMDIVMHYTWVWMAAYMLVAVNLCRSEQT